VILVFFYCRLVLPGRVIHLQEKAKEFASKGGVENLTASNSWVQRFKKCENLTFKTICAEAGG
jgi:hypothetical protein